MGCKHSCVLWSRASVCVYTAVYICACVCAQLAASANHRPSFCFGFDSLKRQKVPECLRETLNYSVCVYVWCLITFSNHLQADRWRNRNICFSLVFLGDLKQSCVYRKLFWPRPLDHISQHCWFSFQFSDVWFSAGFNASWRDADWFFWLTLTASIVWSQNWRFWRWKNNTGCWLVLTEPVALWFPVRCRRLKCQRQPWSVVRPSKRAR